MWRLSGTTNELAGNRQRSASFRSVRLLGDLVGEVLGELIRTTFDEVADRLSDGRPYLCGEHFTAADLTFAALAGPIVLPPEYTVPLPQPPELPPSMATTVEELRAHPAGVHALAMFRRMRPFKKP